MNLSPLFDDVSASFTSLAYEAKLTRHDEYEIAVQRPPRGAVSHSFGLLRSATSAIPSIAASRSCYRSYLGPPQRSVGLPEL